MARPASTQDWQAVDTLEDFVAYLCLLAAEARLAEERGGQWHNTTIPDFLAAIDTLLERYRAKPGSSELTMTTWSEFAALLHSATTEPAAPQREVPERHADPDTVGSLEDLRAYVQWLIEDFRADTDEVAERTRTNKWDNGGRWAHGALPAWLGAWAAWLDDAYLKPLPAMMVRLGIQRTPVEPMSWNSIAIQLSGARIYE